MLHVGRQTVGQTDMMKLKVTLCNSVNVLKMCNFVYYYLSSIAREFQRKIIDAWNINGVVEMNKIITILRCRWSGGWLCNGQCTG